MSDEHLMNKQYSVPYTLKVQVWDDDDGHTWTVNIRSCEECGKKKRLLVINPQDYDDCYSFFCKSCAKGKGLL